MPIGIPLIAKGVTPGAGQFRRDPRWGLSAENACCGENRTGGSGLEMNDVGEQAGHHPSMYRHERLNQRKRPIIGWALWLARFPFIDRASRERAIRTLDKAARLLRTGTSLVIFPEGTRSPDGRLLPFKKGGFILALQAGVPIVPVSIRGGGEVLPKGSLRLRPGCIEVIFGAPVSTSHYTMGTKEQLIEEVRRRILAGLTA